MFWYTCTLRNDQIREISKSITSNTCYFFVVRSFRILSSSYFEILLSIVIVNHTHPAVQQITRASSSCLTVTLQCQWVTGLCPQPSPWALLALCQVDLRGSLRKAERDSAFKEGPWAVSGVRNWTEHSLPSSRFLTSHGLMQRGCGCLFQTGGQARRPSSEPV